jgi:phage tail-like protein
VSRGPSALANPHPLARHLPAIYQQEDVFATALTEGLDQVLAPIFAALDNLDAYLDPQLTPEDFLHWLAGWLAVELDESWPLPQRRDSVARATDLYRIRGTARGLIAYLETVTGGRVEIRETGGSAFSTRADAALPGSPGLEMVVRIEVDDTSPPALARLDALVDTVKPAHIKHRVEAYQRGSGGGA